MRTQILYNPLSNNNAGLQGVEEIKAFYPEDEMILTDITKLDSLEKYLDAMPMEDRFILCGGDGTLHSFVNEIDGLSYDRDIYYYAAGSGNDFLVDVGRKKEEGPFVINDYIRDLPFVCINGKTMRFINNVGFGLDGYVCEVADQQRGISKKKINYTAIALKGLMGGYHPADAIVVVDGVKKSYKNVWLAPTMKGRYCGGGMKLCPSQDRNAPDRVVTSSVMHNCGKLKALMRFTKVTKGEHQGFTEMVEERVGHEISVTFDTPCAMQVDGETFLGVLQYRVWTEPEYKN